MKSKKKLKFDYTIDIMLIGYTSSGKTSIFDRYFNLQLTDEKPSKLCDTDIKSKIIDFDDKKLKVTIYCSYYDRFRPDRIPTFRVDGIIIVYDIINLTSFEICKDLFGVAKRWSFKKTIITLAGNKIDLIETEINKRAIPIESVNEFVDIASISNYTECSAKYNINIETLFLENISRVYNKKKEEKEEKERKENEKQINQKSDKIINHTCKIN